MMRPRAWAKQTIFRLASLGLILVLATPAFAAGSNVVSALELSEQEDRTVIRIVGSKKPTFTVFKLASPERLFVDIVDADVSALDPTLNVGNGVINRISAVPYQSGPRQIGRLVIGFDRAASYDIQSSGSDLLVLVDGAGRQQPDLRLKAAQAEALRVERAVEREKKLLSDLKQARLSEDKLRQEARLARSQEEELERRITSARKDAERLMSAARVEADRLTKDLKQLQAKKQLKADEIEALGRAVAAEQARKKTVEDGRTNAEALKRETERAVQLEKAKLAALRVTTSRAEKERDSALKALEALRARDEVNKRLATAKAAGRDVSRIKRELKKATGSLKKVQRAHEQARADLAEAKLAQAQAEASLRKTKAKQRELETERREMARIALEKERERAGALRAALSAEAREDAARRAQQLARASDLAQENLSALEATLAERRARVQSYQEKAEVEAARIRLIKNQLDNEKKLLSKVRAQREAEEGRLADMRARLTKTKAHLRAVEAKAGAAERARQAAEARTQRAQSALARAEAKTQAAAMRLTDAVSRIEDAEARQRAALKRQKQAESKRKAAQIQGKRASSRADKIVARKAARQAVIERRTAKLEAKAARAERLAAKAEAKRARAEQRAAKAATERATADRQAAAAAQGAAAAEAKRIEAERLASLAEAKREKAEQLASAAETRREVVERELAQAESKRQPVSTPSVEVPAGHDSAPPASTEQPSTAASVVDEVVTASDSANVKALPVLSDLKYANTDEGAELRLSVDGEVNYKVVRHGARRIELQLSKLSIPRELERSLDTSELQGPIRLISSFRSADAADTVRVVVDLRDEVADPILSTDNDIIRWHFRRVGHQGATVADLDPAAPKSQRPGRRMPPGIAAYPGAVGAETGQVSGAGAAGAARFLAARKNRRSKRKYSGKKINLTIKDADIQHVLTFLAKEGGVNIVASDAVSGQVTFHLENIPWDLALDMILKTQGYDYVKEAGVYRVAPAEVIRDEFETELKKRQTIRDLKPMVVRFVTVNYAELKTLSEHIKTVLSKNGTVSVDSSTSTLIIKDIEEHVQAAEDIVRRLDVQLPQVLIEARIVEASTNFARDMGIQWGGNFTMSPGFGNPTGLQFPSIVGVSGGADDSSAPTTGLLSSQPNFAINLPAAAGLGSGGALGITLGSLGGAANVALRLSSAETEGSVKIVSAPKILTLDGEKAKIRQGVSIPVPVVSANGVNTQFFNADLSLDVETNTSPDGNIRLKLQIQKNEPDFGQTSSNGAPTIQTKEANTSLLVRDGETVVIGGIYTRNTGSSTSKLPFLGDIPILGWFFSSTRASEQRSELLIFITPRIANRRASIIDGAGSRGR